jgi:hypothetical protein
LDDFFHGDFLNRGLNKLQCLKLNIQQILE